MANINLTTAQIKALALADEKFLDFIICKAFSISSHQEKADELVQKFGWSSFSGKIDAIKALREWAKNEGKDTSLAYAKECVETSIKNFKNAC